jgi:hypothetical protein
MTPFLLLWVLLLGAGSGTPAALADAALLPPDGFLQIWKKSDKPRLFSTGDLYGYIDGGAEMFLEFGFEQLTVQRYKPDAQPGAAKNAADEFTVEIYRMADPVAATGMYLMNCGREAPDASFTERHTLNQFQLLFRRNRYYVMVNNAEGNEKLRAAMLEFGRYVASRMPAGVPEKLPEALPAKGLDKSSVRLIRGPYALQSVFTLGNGDILQLGRKLTAVSGNYQDAAGNYSLILADYPNAPAAQKAFLNVQNNLDTYLKIQEKNERRLIFKDFKNEYGTVSVAGPRLTIQVHLAKKPALQ